VGPGGTGYSARPGSYYDAVARLEEASSPGGRPLPMPRVYVDVYGRVAIDDGRHRFAAVRDAGHTVTAVSVPARQAEQVMAQVGAARAAPPEPVRALAPARKTAGKAPAKKTRELKTSPSNMPYTQRAERVDALRARLANYSEGDRKVAEIQRVSEHYHTLREAEAARRAEMNALVARTAAAKGADADKEALRGALHSSIEAHDAAHDATERAHAKTRFAISQILQQPLESSVTFDAGGLDNLSESGRRGAQRAVAWIEGITAGTHRPQLAFRTAGKEEKGRAYYEKGTVALSDFSTPETAVHEIGHLLEHQIPGWNDAAQAYLRHRVGEEPLAQLRTVPELRDSSYSADEWGRKDRWEEAFGKDAWYIGKDYGFEASEITAMGLEQLYRDPVGFVRKDPEYVKFLLGMLDGSLR
jgi:hypothetical protein